MERDIAPMIISVFLFLSAALVIAIFVWTRHRERMSLIEKGTSQAEITALFAKSVRPANPLSSLKWGIFFIMVGLAVLIGVWLEQTYMVNDGVIPGLMALLGGAGLLLFHAIAGRKKE